MLILSSRDPDIRRTWGATTSALFWSVSADDPVSTSCLYPYKPECGK